MRYLDPKNDLIFKKVFGNHPRLLISFLNALLPLDEGRHIESLEYLTGEMVPDVPLVKHSIVDVRCRDNYGRQFIVEMQMLWTDAFKSRVLFNAAKAYVNQLGRGRKYEGLQPVYALSLVNENFDRTSPEFYHHYRIVHTTQPDRLIEGLEFVFVELPKFKARNLRDQRMQVLWLRYLTEIQDQTTAIAPELLAVPEVNEAVEYLRESSFSVEELFTYDRYWDAVSSERTLLSAAQREGRAEGLAEGKAEGKAEAARETARRLLALGVAAALVQEATGLTPTELAELTGL